MRGLLNTMKLQAQQAAPALMRVGTVTSYDAANYAVKVALQPEGAITGWLPILTAWSGNGWGLFAPPTPGDLIEVQFHDGDFNAGVACLRFFNDGQRPLAVPSGEFWLVHASGAYVKLTNDGKVRVNAGAEIDIGDLGAALHTLVTDAFVALFNSHTHANGAPPDQTMGASHLTAVLKAN